MAGASQELHESPDSLSPETIDLHRALVSIQEELEAVDWYNQRAEATSDPELKAILEHNRDEEREHASMVLEWVRRNSPIMDEQLRNYLFTDVPIVQVEEAIEGGDAGAAGKDGPGDGSLGIGSLRTGR